MSYTGEQIGAVKSAIHAVRLDYCAWDVWEELTKIPGTPPEILEAAEKVSEHLSDRSDDAVDVLARALKLPDMPHARGADGEINDEAYEALRDAVVESMWEKDDTEGALMALSKIDEDERLMGAANDEPDVSLSP